MNERIRTAAILIPLVLGVILLTGKIGLALLLAAAAYVGVKEFLAFAHRELYPFENRFVPLWGAVTVLAFLFPHPGAVGATLALGAVGYLMGLALGPGPTRTTLAATGQVLAGWLYVAFFLGHGIYVRGFGLGPILFIMVLVMVGDSAAYFVGSAIGRTKLAPRVSPNKTVEGSLGGLAATGLAAMGMSYAFELPHTAMQGLCIGLALNVVAQAGDLVESLLKRSAQVKDSGDIFPGHGGMLDRIDSFLPTLPLYAAILAMLGG